MRRLKTLWCRLSSATNPHGLPLLFVGLGILLRTKHYVENPSFWGDEAWVAHAVMRRSLNDIGGALNIDRHDPLGFQLIEKYLVTLFGDSEFVFRLFPFVCSIGAVILFYFLAKRYLRPPVLAIATGLFALCDQLTLYAAETHPYSCDILITIILFLWFKQIPNTPSAYRARINALLLGMGGAVCIWISYPSLFILGSIALITVLNCLRTKDRRTLYRFLIPLGLWVLSFAIYHTHYLHAVIHKPYMKTFLTSLNPHPPLSPAWIKTFLSDFISAFEMPLGLIPAGYGGMVFGAGSFLLFHKNKDLFYLTHIPIALTLIAASLALYPFHGRLIIFLVPVMILVVSEGAALLIEKNHICPQAISPLVLVLLFIGPVSASGSHFIHKREIAEVRPLIAHLKQHWKTGDALFMENDTQYPYFYYTHRLNFPNAPRPTAVFSNRPFRDTETGEFFFLIAYEGWKSCTQIGPGRAIPCVDKRVYADSQGVFPETPRAWFLIAQTRGGLEDLLLAKLNRTGKKMEEVRTPTSSLILYDLSGE